MKNPLFSASRSFRFLFATSLLLSLSCHLYAQDDSAMEEDPDIAEFMSTIEEVVVTARKRLENMQDTPLSITTLNAQEIEQLGIETTEDVIKLSPGLTYFRGIGSPTEAFARLDYHYLSKRWENEDNLSEIPEKKTWDIQLGTRYKDAWEVIAYVNNVTDDDAPESAINFVDFAVNFQPYMVVYLPPPRHAGLRVKFRF